MVTGVSHAAALAMGLYLSPAATPKVVAALESIDYSEAAMIRAPHVQFVSAESTAVTGLEITNRINFFQRDKLDIWLMRQRQSPKEGDQPDHWSLVSIVVDHGVAPAKAYFMEFAPKPVDGLPEPIEPRVPCLRCHANGPRFIRPNRGAKNLEALKVFNQRIAQVGVIEAYDGGEGSSLTKLLSDPEANAHEPLTLPACRQCHDPASGIRNSVTRQNAGSIIYLLTHGQDKSGYAVPVGHGIAPAMPLDDEPLSEAAFAKIEQWLATRNSAKVQTLTIDDSSSTIVAKVHTSVASFKVEELHPSGMMKCTADQRHCGGTVTLDLATAKTGIRVRDRHLQTMLGLSSAAQLKITDISWLDLAKGEPVTIVGQLSLAGKVAAFSAPVRCRKSGAPGPDIWRCVFTDLSWDIRAHGLVLPTFLGISVDPLVSLDGEFTVKAALASLP